MELINIDDHTYQSCCGVLFSIRVAGSPFLRETLETWKSQGYKK
jgi:hypothetical protein